MNLEPEEIGKYVEVFEQIKKVSATGMGKFLNFNIADDYRS